MPVFLHRPDPEARIAELVRARKCEDQRLDFKSVFWAGTPEWIAKEEAGKDVAAFANAEGGDILVGIKTEKVEGADVAIGFHDAPDLRIADGGDRGVQLKDWLRGRITPREMVETVDTGLLQVHDESGRMHDVLVVSVAAWPHGPVAALKGERQEVGGKDPAYFFPVRRGEHTRCLTFEEIMRFTEGSLRSKYLRLLELYGKEQIFSLASPVMVDDGRVYAPFDSAGKYHGVIEAVSSDAVTLAMNGTSPLTTSQEVPFDRKLSVSLELITAAWRDPEEPRRLGLALSATVVWNGNRWTFAVGEHPG